MAGSTAVARALVAYDASLAELVLRLVAAELGAASDGDVARLRSAIEHIVPNDASESKTTVEWKAGFAHVERLRSLGLELAKLLEQR